MTASAVCMIDFVNSANSSTPKKDMIHSPKIVTYLCQFVKLIGRL
ncbi:MAG: hypothetical protein ACI8RD_011129 [Bacillariaceae sp.]|jgi:hypothetical protein